MTIASTDPTSTATLTALVAGQSRPNVEDVYLAEVSLSLSAVVRQLNSLCLSQGGSLRLLTGAGPAVTESVEDEIARIACAQGLELHLLSPGPPSPLTSHQARAERQVWLGAQAVDLATDEPHDLCHEIGLGFSDLLLVVRDNKVAADEQGRTFRMILDAALAMKPVIWVDALGAIRVLDRITLTQAQRHLLQCPRPSWQILLDCFSGPLDTSGLEVHLQAIAAGAPTDAASPESGPAIVAGASHAGTVHRIMMALVQGHPVKALRALAAKPITAYRGPAWAASEGLLAPTASLDAQFDRADILATVAAGKHRSAAWVSSAASTMAVFAAVAGAIHLWSNDQGVFWAVAELGLVALVIALLWRARHQQWHSHWIANRFVAEQLRYARMGLPVLALTKSLFESSSCVLPDATGVPQLKVLSPDLKVLQKTLASLGLPMPADGGPFIAARAESLPRLRDYVLSVLHDQIAYHERVHAEQHATEHVLHRLSLLLFCLTGAAVAGHFVLHANWLLIFTAFFPALAAGIHGLSTSLEISRIAEQSKATAADLHHLSVAMGQALNPQDSTWRQWVQLRHLTLLAAGLMSDENGQWQKLVTHQKPKLPA